MIFYIALLGIIVVSVILVFGLYMLIHCLSHLKIYTMGITNKKNKVLNEKLCHLKFVLN